VSDDRPVTSGPEPTYDRVVSGYRTFHHPRLFRCEWGGVLPELTLAWESWGELAPDGSNAILLQTGLSASSHAHSHPDNTHPGWWEEFIGPGRSLDTDRWFVVCSNLLGGCYGSTGPSALDPRTGAPYGPDFPVLTVADMVRAQLLLLDHLGIERLHAAVGASLGGMQSLQLAALVPERVDRVVSISACGQSHPMSVAMRYVQRQAVLNDPAWAGGRYYGQSFPHVGLKLAREIGTITYRSGPEWEERFGRKRRDEGVPHHGPDFEVESYLDYQGEKFCLMYDPNSYLVISKAMDLFDLGCGQPSYEAGLARVACPSLVVGVRSDMLFPCWQQREIAAILEKHQRPTRYVEIDAPYGHDTFLIEVEAVGGPMRRFLES
jgi:homoserine O-acetyltransferase